MIARHSGLIYRRSVFAWIAFATGLILLVPLVAMGFTEEVNWKLGDFLIMALLLFGAGSLFVYVCRRFPDMNKFVIGVMVTTLFLYVWAELAVGILFNG